MTREREAEIRAAAMVYFAQRMNPPEETIAMSLDEIALLYAYLARQEIAAEDEPKHGELSQISGDGKWQRIRGRQQGKDHASECLPNSQFLSD